MRYYKRTDNLGITTTVESYSHNSTVKGAVKITKQEFDDYINSLPKPIEELPRNLAAELDELKTEIKILKDKLS